LKETQEMRERLTQLEKSGPWDVKLGPGGAQDIDLFGQAAAVFVGKASSKITDWMQCAVASGWCSDTEAEQLITARGLYWRVAQASRLVSDKGFDPNAVGSGGVSVLLRDTKCLNVEELLERLEKCRKQSKEVIDRVMTPD
jgi:glutamate-ammonia-ligase adenylyltransferase